MAEGYDLKAVLELIELKQNDPEKYTQFLVDYEEVVTDLTKLAMKVAGKCGFFTT